MLINFGLIRSKWPLPVLPEFRFNSDIYDWRKRFSQDKFTLQMAKFASSLVFLVTKVGNGK